MAEPLMQGEDNPLGKVDAILQIWARTVRDNIKRETGHSSYTIEYIMALYGGDVPKGQGKAPMPWNDWADAVEVALMLCPVYYRKAIIVKYLWGGTDETKAVDFGKQTSGRQVSKSFFLATVKNAQAWLHGRWGDAWVEKNA